MIISDEIFDKLVDEWEEIQNEYFNHDWSQYKPKPTQENYNEVHAAFKVKESAYLAQFFGVNDDDIIDTLMFRIDRRTNETQSRSSRQENKMTEAKLFSKEHFDEMWGSIVIGIGSGNGRTEMIAQILSLAQDRYLAGVNSVVVNNRKDDKLIDNYKRLLRHAEAQQCEHEDTHRGGAIWEICDACGCKWADDEGGKPESEEPTFITNARQALDDYLA